MKNLLKQYDEACVEEKETSSNGNIIEEDISPKCENKTNVIHAFYLAADSEGVMHSDLTGRFPITSLQGNKHILLIYNYDANAIIVRALKNRSDIETLKTHEEVYELLKNRGFSPKLHVLDNEASKALKKQITKTGAKYQLVKPHNHRVLAAERCIRTFKNHFIAGLTSTDPNFPFYLWDQLLHQAEITLNLLRNSRQHPQLSAYAYLCGNFDYNKTPLAPPGTKAVMLEDPDTRASWAPHGKTAWYVGPAMEHHRSFSFYIPETGGTRTSASVQFFLIV